MHVVMSSSPDWSENFIIFHITYDSVEALHREMVFTYPILVFYVEPDSLDF